MFSNFEAFQKQAFELGQQLLTADGDDDSDSDLEGVDTGGFGMTVSAKQHAASDSPAKSAQEGATAHKEGEISEHPASLSYGQETDVR